MDFYNKYLCSKNISTSAPTTVTPQITQESESPSKVEEEKEESDHIFIAVARVFSGTIKKGQQIYVLGPKHDADMVLETVRKFCI